MQRFAGVKLWELEYKMSADNPHSWEEGGVSHHRTQWRESSHGSFQVPTAEYYDGILRVMGDGPSFDELSIAKQSSSPWQRSTRYDRGAGASRTTVDFLLDLNTGTYDASFMNGYITVEYGGTETSGSETRSYGPLEAEEHVHSPHSAPAYVRFKLPESGVVIRGEWSWEQMVEAEKRLEPQLDWEQYPQANATRGSIEWTLRPATPPAEVELWLEAVDAEDWLPQGGRDERAPANDVVLRAYLLPKDGDALRQHAVEFEFFLSEVSREPGVALNVPLSGASLDPDLQFVGERNPEAEIGAEGQRLTIKGEALSEASARLSAFDWGAYGSVEVVARLDNGRTLRARVTGGASHQLKVPRRSSGGLIGDAWREAYAFSGADGDDDDAQAGNGKPGDGLTAYEEYRGLVLDGRHTRQDGLLTPRTKQLVVIDEVGAAAATGISWFETASDIRVLKARADEFPEDRRVNVNRASASGGAQHALRLIAEPVDGETAGVNRPESVLNKTPRLSEAAVVDLALAGEHYAQQAAVARAAGMPLPYSLSDDIAQTIAHELAHGVGAPHHGKGSEFFGKRTVTAKMKDYPVYGVDGNRLVITEDKPFELQGNIGRPGNESSGDLDCIMAYPNYYQWAAVGPTSGPYRFYAIAPQVPGRIFCTTAAGTRYNQPHAAANGARIPGFFGNAAGQAEGAPQGNCLGAMQVRDW